MIEVSNQLSVSDLNSIKVGDEITNGFRSGQVVSISKINNSWTRCWEFHLRYSNKITVHVYTDHAKNEMENNPIYDCDGPEEDFREYDRDIND